MLLRELIWFPFWGERESKKKKKPTRLCKKVQFCRCFYSFLQTFCHNKASFLSIYYTEACRLKATKGASVRYVAKSIGDFDMQRTQRPSPPPVLPHPPEPKELQNTQKSCKEKWLTVENSHSREEKRAKTRAGAVSRASGLVDLLKIATFKSF